MERKFVVVEIQTHENGAVGNIVTAYDNRNDAGSKYHTILAAAAVSSLPCHTAVMLDNYGNLLAADRYTHEEEPNNG